MQISEPSVAEIQIQEEIQIMNDIIATTLITVSDANRICSAACKVLMKCEELRKSREKWRAKYEELEKNKRGEQPLD